MELLIGFTSVLVSTFGSLVGFGGGVFLVPILVLFFDYPLPLAVGSAIVSLVPASFINTLFNHKQGNVDYKTGIILEIPTTLGVLLGSFLLSLISVGAVKIVFIVSIFFLSLSFIKKKTNKTSKVSKWLESLNQQKPKSTIHNKTYNVSYSINYILATFMGLIAGGLAGLFGIGGGFIKTPIMIKAFKLPAKVAAGTGLFMILITSSIGSATHYSLGHVQLQKALPVVIGFALGALISKPINKRMTHGNVEMLIGVSLLLAALMMLIDFL